MSNPIEKLIQAIKSGSEANFASHKEELNDATKGQEWGEERTLLASQLIDLLEKYGAAEKASYKPVIIKGAKIKGEFNCSYLNYPFSLFFHNCYFEKNVNFQGAYIQNLEFYDCYLKQGFNGQQITTQGNLFLFRSTVEQKCDLFMANIQGACDLTTVFTFDEDSDNWLVNAGRIYVRDNFVLNCITNGPVNIAEAKIDGNLFIKNADIYRKKQDYEVLRAEYIQVQHSLIMEKSRIVGNFNLLYAQIKGSWLSTEVHFFVTEGTSISGGGSKIQGLTRFVKCKVEGEVHLVGTELLMNLELKNSEFISRGNTAIEASHLILQGMLQLSEDTKLQGTLRLGGAKIKQAAYFYKCHIEALDSLYALETRSACIEGGMEFSKDFSCQGIIDLYGVTIDGTLQLDGNFTINDKSYLLINATEAKISLSVLARGNFDGEVSFYGANIGIDIACSKGSFTALDFTGTKAGATLYLTNQLNTLILRNTEVERLEDQINTLPESLEIEGLRYNSITSKDVTLKQRKRWLAKASKQQFSPQPFEQLVKVLKNHGNEEDARKVAIAKHRAQRKFGKISIVGWLGSLFLDTTIAYGYRPLRGLFLMIIFIMFGVFLFGYGFDKNKIIPSSSDILLTDEYTKCPININPNAHIKDCVPPDYPAFQPIVYSLDVFLPIIDLHQERYWLPREGWIRSYFWIHIALGWILSTVIAAGLSGLIKKD